MSCLHTNTHVTWGRYHGGRRPSSDDSLHSPTVIPPSALDKPSITKRYHRWRRCSHTSPRRSPTMVTLHDTRFVECRWWNDGYCENRRHLKVVGLHDTGPRTQSFANHVQHVVRHVVGRDSSASKSDRGEIALIFALFHWLKPLTDDRGEEYENPEKTPNDVCLLVGWLFNAPATC